MVKASALMVMKKDDLVEFSRRSYSDRKFLGYWTDPQRVNSGINDEERALLEKIPVRGGRLLLLGVGGGREAISLGKMGFKVTAVDFIPEMVKSAVFNAAQCGVSIEGLVGEVSRIKLPASTFDVVWLMAAMYSSIPTSKRRINTLQNISKSLRPGGYFLLQFMWNNGARGATRAERLKKMIALLTAGNMTYEKGDLLWRYEEFIHFFSSEDELRGEFAAGGFQVEFLHLPAKSGMGGAVLKKL